MISRRIQEIGLSPTLRINAMAQSMRAEGHDVLDFSAGQPDFPTLEEAKRAGKQAIDENRTRYTANPGLVELRTAIAERIARDHGVTYAPQDVLVSPGGKASLYFACMTLLDPGDQVLLPVPYWVSYPEQIRLAEGEAVAVPCEEANGFRVTAEQLEARWTPRTKLLVLNYPSNPTGACYSRDELESLAEFCVRRNVWVLADEIYGKLMFDGLRFTSIAELGDEIRERTVMINGMSKAYAMTGWRIGYAAGPREVIAGMARIQSHSTSNATSISQWASIEALNAPDDEIERRSREFEVRRDEIVSRLRALPGVTCFKPQGAFYVFPNVSGVFGARVASGTINSSDELSSYLLEAARVAVVPGEGFGSADHIRISYATSMDLIREGMGRIEEAIAALES